MKLMNVFETCRAHNATWSRKMTIKKWSKHVKEWDDNFELMCSKIRKGRIRNVYIMWSIWVNNYEQIGHIIIQYQFSCFIMIMVLEWSPKCPHIDCDSLKTMLDMNELLWVEKRLLDLEYTPHLLFIDLQEVIKFCLNMPT